MEKVPISYYNHTFKSPNDDPLRGNSYLIVHYPFINGLVPEASVAHRRWDYSYSVLARISKECFDVSMLNTVRILCEIVAVRGPPLQLTMCVYLIGRMFLFPYAGETQTLQNYLTDFGHSKVSSETVQEMYRA
jgi:hypothetical protein